MTIPPQDYDVVLRMAKAKKVRRQRDSGKAHFRLERLREEDGAP